MKYKDWRQNARKMDLFSFVIRLSSLNTNDDHQESFEFSLSSSRDHWNLRDREETGTPKRIVFERDMQTFAF